MRISTSQMFASNIAGYQNGYSSIVKTQQQISSGVRIQTPADDPVGSARLLQLEQQQAQLDQYKGNLTTAKNSLQQEESVLGSMNNMLQRARELALEAGNGSYSDLDRQAIASELDQIQQQLLSSMNSKDANGQYLFAGSNSGTIPYVINADGSYSYQGDQGSLGLQVSSSLTLSSNDNGWSLFENVANSSRTSTALVASPASGQKAYMGQGFVSNANDFTNNYRAGAPYTLELTSSSEYRVYSKDNPTETVATGSYDANAAGGDTVSFRGVEFSLNVSGLDKNSGTTLDSQLTGHKFELSVLPDKFSISGLNASLAQLSDGSIIDSGKYNSQFPAAGIVIQFSSNTNYQVYGYPLQDGDAPLVKDGVLSGNTLTYSGVQFDISGAPATGDKFIAKPKSQNTQGILDTIANLSKALKQPVTGNDQARYALREAVNSAVTNIDSSMDQVSTTQSSIGARLNTIDTLTVEIESLNMSNTSTQSDIRDTDMAAATSKLVLQKTMLEAAQVSFARVSQLSLFDKL
ncbi:flagellar hook-associated protein 3 [Pseudomonas luteola]|uniref:flagellar hook-associated protein 3 n=1 Tax=Pseudomonas luteola TaxID=47886 RepID=UPI003A839A6B